MFIKFVVLLSSALFASGASIGPEPIPMLDDRIVGGVPMDISQVPWQVSVLRSGSHFCGGSIISKKWILTAAHCTQAVSQNPRVLSVRVGSTDRLKGGYIHKVKRVVQNELFNSFSIDWDFALLELETNVQFDKNAQPVKLVSADTKLKDETLCLVTGWGNTQSSDSNVKLRGAEVPIVNQEQCEEAYSNTKDITPRMLCAGLKKGGKDSCQGDSGGPLVILDGLKKSVVQVGVVSWGYGCARPDFPGVYARITAAREWIYENSGI